MIDMSVHLGDLLSLGGILLAGWKFSRTVRDKARDMEKTVYGSLEPPVEGLVKTVGRHEQWLLDQGMGRRISDHKQGV